MDSRIKNLGTLAGKVLLFGGVYSNLQALEAVIAFAKAEKIPPSNCICTGDIVGYCAQPEETVQKFKEWGAHTIAGNVEQQLSSGAINCGCDFRSGSRCDGFSQMWYPYAQNSLSDDSMNYIESIPDHIVFEYAGREVGVVHGSTRNISEYIFKSSPWTMKASSFSDLDCDVIVAGHCGLPFNHLHLGQLWLNPGVIGMPANDAQQDTWFMVLDDHNGLDFQHKNLSYDFKSASSKMQNQPLPQEYARTLITGIWDNTEILPEIESGLQGFGLRF